MIREYCLPKYKYIRFNKSMFKKNNYKYETFYPRRHLSSFRLLLSIYSSLQEENLKYKDFVADINKKHPSTYRNGIKKLNNIG